MAMETKWSTMDVQNCSDLCAVFQFPTSNYLVENHQVLLIVHPFALQFCNTIHEINLSQTHLNTVHEILKMVNMGTSQSLSITPKPFSDFPRGLYIYIYYDRRKFRSQTSDNMDRWKAEQGRGREKRKIRRKEDGDARKGKKVAKHSVCGAKQISKSKCAKHTSVLLEVAMSKKCRPLWREAHFEVKMYKTHQLRTTFGSCDVEKVHAVVARSTFPSQNVQNTTCSRHFWRFGCWKSARRCGAKHISKSKC